MDSTPPRNTEFAFSPEFLRNVQDRVLIVPRLLDVGNNRASLHVASNGQGDRYYLLRLCPIVPVGKAATEFFHYIGNLNQLEFSLIEMLLAENQSQQVSTGTQRLRQLQPTFESAAIIWNIAKDALRYTAALAGLNTRDYRLYRKRSGSISPTPLPPALHPPHGTPLRDKDQMCLEALRSICTHASDNPLFATLRVLGIMHIDALMTRSHLLDVLGHSFVERSTAISMYGTCRQLTKAESRAITKRNKLKRIADRIHQSQEFVRAEILRKGVPYENW